MNTLKKIGMKRKWIYEGVLQTAWSGAAKRKRNYAPMGYWSDDLKLVKIKAYDGSKTAENLARMKKGEKAKLYLPDEIGAVFWAYFGKFRPGKNVSKIGLEKMRSERGKKFAVYSFKPTEMALAMGAKVLTREPWIALETLIYCTKPWAKKAVLKSSLRTLKKVAPNSKFAGVLERLLERNKAL
ncbi:Uncharacterised protein [Candidatus Gugararchaeum adminiculabundum]|nr:Uncharacterised protein [Candidatus Gugararchaeum adminiculabundum]